MKQFLILFFLPLLILAQNISIIDGIPSDTSFTLNSETIKIRKEYPHAVPVHFKKSDNVFIEENIVYNRIGKRQLHLDLFKPIDCNNKKMTAIIIIHGGGWRTGNRKMEWPAANYLASKGFVCATVEYRLSPEEKYPAGIYDLKNSIKWLKANAEKYCIDTNKIAVYGTSAGGELAAFLGTTCGMKKFEDNNLGNKYSTKVNAIIDVDGIVDFTHPAESDKDKDPQKQSAGKAWFGVAFKDDPTLWIEASPMNYVNKNTPPVIFINSSQNRFHAGRDYMIEKMSHFKIYSEVNTIPNTPHPFWLFQPWFDELMNYTVNFLSKIFNE